MMSTSIILALAVLSSPSGHPQPPIDRAYAEGRWRLDVHQDAFRREVRCRVADDYGHFPKVVAGPRALVFKLPFHADGSSAWFSIDGAPAKPWRDVESALIAQGAMAQSEALDNETNGELPLPYGVVKGARTIAVQTAEGGAIHLYRVGRLWDLLASAKGLGCAFEVDAAGR